MKKHFLLLLMAFFSLAGYAEELDITKFTSDNIPYGSTSLKPNNVGIIKVADGYTATFEIDYDHYYTSEAGAGEQAVVTGTVNNLKTAAPTQYFIKISGTGTYQGSVIYKGFRIYPTIVKIDFDANQKKTYQQNDPASFTYKLLNENNVEVTGDAKTALISALTLTVGREKAGTDEGENAGLYAFTFDWVDKNYQLSQVANDDKFEIEAKAASDLTVTLTTTSAVYSGAAQTPGFTVKAGTETLPNAQFDLKYEYKATATGDYAEFEGDAKNAGFYKVKVKGKDGGNYTGESGFASDVFQITQANLNVYVAPMKKTYTGAEAVISDAVVSYSGLVGTDASEQSPFGDIFKVAFAETGDHVNAGTYGLKITDDKGGTQTTAQANAYKNYKFNPLAGTLTVEPKEITVKPADNQKEFGAPEPSPVSEITVTGAVSTDDATAIKGAYTVSRVGGEEITKEGEGYTISLTKKAETDLTDAQKTALDNYKFTPGTGLFSIVSGTLYVYPESKAITYGDPTPEFTVMATTANGTPVKLTATPAVKVKKADGTYYDKTPTDAGTYVLVVGEGAAAEGYTNIVPLNGQFTIGKATLVITAETQTLAVGDGLTELNADKDKKVRFAGKVEGDVIGFELAFNQVTTETTGTEGMIPANEDGDPGLTYITTANKLGTDADNSTFAKGIKVKEVDATDEKPNANKNYNITVEAGKLVVGNGNTEAADVYTNIVITDNPKSAIASINALNGETHNVTVKLYRKNVLASGTTYEWNQYDWNTMVLPFEVSVSELSAAMGYAIVNTYDESNTKESNAAFKLTMGTIPANTPFLLKTADNIADGFELKLKGKKIVAPTADMVIEAANGISYIGTYENVVINKNNSQAQGGAETYWKYYAANQIKGIGKTSSNEYTVYPFAAFFNWTAPSAAAPTITVQEIDGTFTTIRSISSEKEINASGWYNLNGMKLEGAPTQKGIYIKNGKKIIVK